MTEQPDIRFLYLQDPKNPKRRVTVARLLDKESKTVEVAYAICKPETRHEHGDIFVKKTGRAIAKGRLLKNKKLILPLLPHEQPIHAALVALAEMPADRLIRRIAKHYLDQAHAAQ